MPPIESLERLADSFAALERPVERKRMLVIVNPYATTVSDRLRNLVVYALQSRYSVEAIDTEKREHATQITREAARGSFSSGRSARTASPRLTSTSHVPATMPSTV